MFNSTQGIISNKMHCAFHYFIVITNMTKNSNIRLSNNLMRNIRYDEFIFRISGLFQLNTIDDVLKKFNVTHIANYQSKSMTANKIYICAK